MSDGTTNQDIDAFLPGTPEGFGYDVDGNLTGDGRWEYTYDADGARQRGDGQTESFARRANRSGCPRGAEVRQNRLITMEVIPTARSEGHPWQKVEFAYDYMNRRVRKTFSENLTGTGSGWSVVSDTKYVYDGWNVVAEIDAGTDNLTRSFFWGLDLSGTVHGAGGVSGLLMIQDGGSTYLPAYDAMGNVHALIKTSDWSVAAAYEYDAFGRLLRESGTYAAENPFRFSTKYTDTETGLVYYGHRYYSAELGRFINRDPIGVEGGINLYAFVGNNPINEFDYLGQFSLKRFIKRAWKPVVAGVVGALTGGAVFAALPSALSATTSYAITGAAAGFASGTTNAALHGAPFEDVLKAGAKGAAIGAVAGAISGELFAEGGGAVSSAKQVAETLQVEGPSFLQAAGGAIKDAASHLASQAFREIVAEEAEKHLGISGEKFNAALMGLSFIGNLVTGQDRFFGENETPDAQFVGWFSRVTAESRIRESAQGLAFLPFDIGDTILGYQGLPTATSLRWLTSESVDRGDKFTSHSLGTLDHTNLQKWGVIARGGSVNSLPFGNIAPAGLERINLGAGDVVNGFFLGNVLNPEAKTVRSPSRMPWHYPTRNHLYYSAYLPFQPSDL